MQIVRKIIFLLLVITLFSCNDTGKKHYIIGVSQCSDDAWRRSMNEEMLREASFNPDVQLLIKTAYDSNQKQIRDIENLIAQRVDLLIVSPNEAVPLTPVVEKAMQAGIPVILVDRKIKSGQYTAFVGADNYQIGYEVGVYAANLLNGKGNIVEIRGLSGSTPDLDRHSGFINGIKNFPEIRIVYSKDGGWLRNQAKQQMIEALNLSLPVDLVFAHNDEMGTGAHEAVSVNSNVKKPFIIGIDALPGSDGGIQKVINGTLDATFIYPTGGEKAIQTALRILRKEPYDRDNILYTAVVDKTNARVLKLQTDQIIEHQNRIRQLNSILDENLSQYNTQRVFLLFSLAVIFIILGLLILLFNSFRHKNKINKKLEFNNIAINKQKEELALQRDQLLALSKNIEDATQAKLMFFTNISHEFRTPLTLIMGPLENIVNNETLSNEGKRLALVIKKNVGILLRLIDQIIDFRKYENGKMQMYYTLGNLNTFVSDICNSFSDICKKKKIKFAYNVADEDFTLWFDSDKIEKICYNLLSNAVKFTSENGEIIVSLTSELLENEKYARISVKDTGEGIKSEFINNIFDRFYQIENNKGGSGIGLALTKALIEEHGGRIEVESTLGKGSFFSFVIPYKQKDITIQEQYPVFESHIEAAEDYVEPEMLNFLQDIQQPDIETGKSTILLVEDNKDVCDYVKSLLVHDYKIITADNGQNGIIKALKYIPELVISDVMMDKMNGFELCKHLKTNFSTSHIPVILLTALALDDQKAVGFESGADAYIPKPFNEDLLKIRIRKIIENRDKIKEYFQQNLTFGERKESVSELDKSFMEKFRKIVEDNLIDSELNVDEIGRNMGLSRVQLYRKIKSLTNYAPNELVRIIRLKTAEQLLINSEKTISEIAYETGFTSPSYFTKCFREYFNESPTDYLKKIRPQK